MANDPWFRGLVLCAAPDGGVYVADWCDTGECHNYKDVSPRGRIYKITYGLPKPVDANLAKLDDRQLIALQLHQNDWYVRQARRLLQERSATKQLDKDTRSLLHTMFDDQPEVTRKLRALWALHAIGGLRDGDLMSLLGNPHDVLRAWGVRLIAEGQVPNSLLEGLRTLARAEKSPRVRLALASALQRLPIDQRWLIAEALLTTEFAHVDSQLALMLWYGTEPLAIGDPHRGAKLLGGSNVPLVREFAARRIAAIGDESKLSPLLSTLSKSSDAAAQADILRGMHRALVGQRLSQPPDGWGTVRLQLMASKSVEVRQLTLVLSGVFADPEALAALRRYATDVKEQDAMRRTALQTLLEVKADGVHGLLRELLHDASMRGPAIRGLAAVNDPEAPSLILGLYGKLSEDEKRDAVATLASRPAYALALLDAVEKDQVPRRDLSVFTARQIVNLKDKKLADRLNLVWGTIASAPAADKAKTLAKFKAMVPADRLAQADRAQGRALFAKTCANCHLLFNEGTKLGPDLTGSQRANPEYLLSKLVDPSFAVPRDYQMVVVETKSGRFISGIVTAETAQTITVRTQNEAINLAKSDIESRTPTKQSLMPEGMLDQLKEAEVLALIAYLSGPGQVALPK
jgi:putative heme-binding domain-containing protein